MVYTYTRERVKRIMVDCDKVKMNKKNAKYVELGSLISNDDINNLFNLVSSSNGPNSSSVLFAALDKARDRGENIYTTFLGVKLYSADVTIESVRQAQYGHSQISRKKRFSEKTQKECLKQVLQNSAEIKM